MLSLRYSMIHDVTKHHNNFITIRRTSAIEETVQGAVFGTFLLPLYINNVSTDTGSEIRLFACLLARNTRCRGH